MINNNKKRIIGLTGGIGAGKSAVSAYLSSLGAVIADADKISRELSQKGNEGYFGIISRFGEDILDENKEIDRKKLAAIVFSDKEKLIELEGILHPLIEKKIVEIIDSSDSVVIIDAPLLHHAGLDRLCDEVWSVSCSEEIRINRIKTRDNVSYEMAKMRIKNQLPQEKIDSMSDVVIYNDKDLEYMKKQVTGALDGEK